MALKETSDSGSHLTIHSEILHQQPTVEALTNRGASDGLDALQLTTSRDVVSARRMEGSCAWMQGRMTFRCMTVEYLALSCKTTHETETSPSWPLLPRLDHSIRTQPLFCTVHPMLTAET